MFGAISTLAIMVRYKTYLEIEADAAKSPILIYLSGFIILLIGLLLVVSHQVWTRDWRVVITIFGWLFLLKGIIRIFFPEAVKKLFEKKRDDRRFIVAEVMFFLFSLYLIYKGFF